MQFGHKQTKTKNAEWTRAIHWLRRAGVRSDSISFFNEWMSKLVFSVFPVPPRNISVLNGEMQSMNESVPDGAHCRCEIPSDIGQDVVRTISIRCRCDDDNVFMNCAYLRWRPENVCRLDSSRSRWKVHQFFSIVIRWVVLVWWRSVKIKMKWIELCGAWVSVFNETVFHSFMPSISIWAI